MLDKIMAILAGIVSICFGLSIIVAGGHNLYGSWWEYGTLKIPVGIILIIIGVVIIFFSLSKKKKHSEKK